MFRRQATSLSRRKQAKNIRQEQKRASGGGSELDRARSLCNDVTSKNTRTFINTAVRASNRPTLVTVHTLSFVHRILCDLKLKWTSSKDNTAGRSQLRSLRVNVFPCFLFTAAVNTVGIALWRGGGTISPRY